MCRNEFGLCNIFGSIDCKTCGKECKTGYEGNQCEYCKKGFFVSNGVPIGNVNATSGEGPLCKGK